MTRESEPRTLNAILAELGEALKTGPQHTCTNCGELFGPVASPLCWQCDEDERQEALRKQRALEDLAAVDRRFRSATLETYACPPGDMAALQAVQAWAWKPEARGLFIYGAPGTGKSHLAFALAKRCIEQGLRVFASEWTDLLHRLRDTFDGRPGETAGDIHRRIERADVVLIDDMATGKATEWAVEQAWAIVQGRYQAEKPLVLTSNFSLGELSQRIGGIDGQRIASRLAEMSERIHVQAQDYRLGGNR